MYANLPHVASLFVGANGRDLNFAEVDAASYFKLFTSGLGPSEPEHALLRIGERATVAGLDNAFATLQVRRPDFLVFGYSGHANQRELVLNHGRYSYGRLAARLRSIDAVATFVILDACNSESFVDSYGLGGDISGVDVDWAGALAGAVPGSRLVFAARRKDTTLETSQLGHGVLTYSLVKSAMTVASATLQGPGGQLYTSDLDWVDRASALMHQLSGQRPVVYGLDGSFPVLRSTATPVGHSRLVRARRDGLDFDFRFELTGRRYLRTTIEAVAVNGAEQVIGRKAWTVVPKADPCTFRKSVSVAAAAIVSDPVTQYMWSTHGRLGVVLRVKVTDAVGREIPKAA